MAMKPGECLGFMTQKCFSEEKGLSQTWAKRVVFRSGIQREYLEAHFGWIAQLHPQIRELCPVVLAAHSLSLLPTFGEFPLRRSATARPATACQKARTLALLDFSAPRVQAKDTALPVASSHWDSESGSSHRKAGAVENSFLRCDGSGASSGL